MKSQSYYTKIRRYRMKLEAVRLKGGKCIKCGWSGNIAAFQFHHRNPLNKEFAISMLPKVSWEVYWNEVEKCDLLCANCHMIHHSDNCNEKFLRDVQNYKGRTLVVSNIPWKNGTRVAKKYNKICPTCKLPYTTSILNQKYCSYVCRNKSKQKCERPTKDELKKLIETVPMIHVGKQYGVTGNTIKKWCKQYNLV